MSLEWSRRVTALISSFVGYGVVVGSCRANGRWHKKPSPRWCGSTLETLCLPFLLALLTPSAFAEGWQDIQLGSNIDELRQRYPEATFEDNRDKDQKNYRPFRAYGKNRIKDIEYSWIADANSAKLIDEILVKVPAEANLSTDDIAKTLTARLGKPAEVVQSTTREAACRHNKGGPTVGHNTQMVHEQKAYGFRAKDALIQVTKVRHVCCADAQYSECHNWESRFGNKSLSIEYRSKAQIAPGTF